MGISVSNMEAPVTLSGQLFGNEILIEVRMEGEELETAGTGSFLKKFYCNKNKEMGGSWREKWSPQKVVFSFLNVC